MNDLHDLDNHVFRVGYVCMNETALEHVFAWWGLYDAAIAQHLTTANVGSRLSRS